MVQTWIMDAEASCCSTRTWVVNSMMKVLRISAGMLLVLCVILVIARVDRKPQGDLIVRFITLTNDLAGTNLAVFTLSHGGRCSIEVGLPGEIELRNTKCNNPGYAVFPVTISPSRQPLTVKVVAPQTQDQWRVAFHYYPVSLRDRLNRSVAPLVNRFAAPLGIQMRGRAVIVSTAHSEWMGPTVQFEWMAY